MEKKERWVEKVGKGKNKKVAFRRKGGGKHVCETDWGRREERLKD